jgi:hypothetical protein
MELAVPTHAQATAIPRDLPTASLAVMERVRRAEITRGKGSAVSTMTSLNHPYYTF